MPEPFKPTPKGTVSKPLSNKQYRKHFLRNAVTAGKRKARRSSKGKKSGRRTWMSNWPSSSTQKGGKNAGRPCSYSDRPAMR